MLKVYIESVNHEVDYDRYSMGFGLGQLPRNRRIEVRGRVAGGYEDASLLLTSNAVLVPIGSVEAPTNTRWLKALAATCTPAEVAKITAAFEAQPREPD